jgi:hypothetical protein
VWGWIDSTHPASLTVGPLGWPFCVYMAFLRVCSSVAIFCNVGFYEGFYEGSMKGWLRVSQHLDLIYDRDLYSVLDGT